MKYFYRVCVVLLIAVGIVFGFSYYYKEKKINENIVLTTSLITTKKKNEPTTSAETVYYDDNGFRLFTYKNKGYIEYNNVKKEAGGFEWALSQKSIDFKYGDFDNDKQNELLVLYFSPSYEINNSLLAQDKEDFSNFHRFVVMIKPFIDDEGKQDFKLIYADQNTWKKPFEQAISAKMNQLKSCDKYLQFVMDDNNVELKYDESTGLSQNKHVFYAQALKDSTKNGYQKFVKWSKGEGNYYIGDDGTLQLNIMILAYYEGASKAQYVGDIHTNISINKYGSFSLTPKTIVFIPKDKYTMPDIRKNTAEKFTYILNNNSSQTVNTNENYIDWLDASFEISSNMNTQTVSFANLDSQIKCVDKVKITQSSVVLTAKEGYTFSSRVLDKGDYSLTVNGRDIAYNAEILEKEEKSVLKITYDKKYNKDEIKNIEIKFGS